MCSHSFRDRRASGLQVLASAVKAGFWMCGVRGTAVLGLGPVYCMPNTAEAAPQPDVAVGTSKSNRMTYAAIVPRLGESKLYAMKAHYTTSTSRGIFPGLCATNGSGMGNYRQVTKYRPARHLSCLYRIDFRERPAWPWEGGGAALNSCS